MENNVYKWSYKEFNLSLINVSTSEKSAFDNILFNIEVVINTSETIEKLIIPIEDELLVTDLKDCLNRLLLHNFRNNSILVSSVQKLSEDQVSIECYSNSYMTKEEIGEPMIDGHFFIVERFDHEIKKHLYDNSTLQTLYRITLSIPLRKGSSVFKAIIINDIPEDKLRELYLMIESLDKFYSQTQD